MTTANFDMDAYEELLKRKTKLVAVVHVSNALGTVNPVKEIIAAAHQAGAISADRWCTVCRSSGYRCSGYGLRFFCLFRP